MNAIQHLLVCLGEEGAEVAQDAAKALRFGLADTNCLKPDGPTNAERLVNELNDLLGVAEMLVWFGALPADWQSAQKQSNKKARVVAFMKYAANAGTLDHVAFETASLMMEPPSDLPAPETLNKEGKGV